MESVFQTRFSAGGRPPTAALHGGGCLMQAVCTWKRFKNLEEHLSDVPISSHYLIMKCGGRRKYLLWVNELIFSSGRNWPWVRNMLLPEVNFWSAHGSRQSGHITPPPSNPLTSIVGKKWFCLLKLDFLEYFAVFSPNLLEYLSESLVFFPNIPTKNKWWPFLSCLSCHYSSIFTKLPEYFFECFPHTWYQVWFPTLLASSGLAWPTHIPDNLFDAGLIGTELAANMQLSENVNFTIWRA